MVAIGQTVVKAVTTSVTQTTGIVAFAGALEFPVAATDAARAEMIATVENCILKDLDWNLLCSLK